MTKVRRLISWGFHPNFTVMNDEDFMRQALQQAQKAFDDDEVPIGAVIVLNTKIISRGYNQVERLNDSTAHAEIIALTSAFNLLGSKYLPDATIYITVEPCIMCAGALYWSKIARVVYGAEDPKNGYGRHTHSNSPFHPKTTLTHGILKEECAELLTSFFKNKR
ncbi:MAG TPA: nucleoside deaminase [Flavisolibacter sp.]|nr:nucleoside deaminase [Flavisolibacter sp.]